VGSSLSSLCDDWWLRTLRHSPCVHMLMPAQRWECFHASRSFPFTVFQGYISILFLLVATCHLTYQKRYLGYQVLVLFASCPAYASNWQLILLFWEYSVNLTAVTTYY
jgi:hypothetical protein